MYREIGKKNMAKYEIVDGVCRIPQGTVVIESGAFKDCKELRVLIIPGLKAFHEEHPEARLIIVSLDAAPRLFNGVEVLPAKVFLRKLWEGTIV